MSQPADLDPGVPYAVGNGGATARDSAPRHGFRGERGPARAAPLGLSVTLSREAVARGGTIARLVGEKLSWQVYDQDLIEYMAQNPVIRQDADEGLAPACVGWLEQRLEELKRTYGLG